MTTIDSTRVDIASIYTFSEKLYCRSAAYLAALSPQPSLNLVLSECQVRRSRRI